MHNSASIQDLKKVGICSCIAMAIKFYTTASLETSQQSDDNQMKYGALNKIKCSLAAARTSMQRHYQVVHRSMTRCNFKCRWSNGIQSRSASTSKICALSEVSNPSTTPDEAKKPSDIHITSNSVSESLWQTRVLLSQLSEFLTYPRNHRFTCSFDRKREEEKGRGRSKSNEKAGEREKL